jgi:hypothetical protein
MSTFALSESSSPTGSVAVFTSILPPSSSFPPACSYYTNSFFARAFLISLMMEAVRNI